MTGITNNWFSLCRKHLTQVYRKTQDGYASLDRDLRKKYRCGFAGCRQVPTVEYYPGLGHLVRESEADLRAGRVYTLDQVETRFRKRSRVDEARRH